mmetsp:Transcript_16548/g.25028  ORF Transcript_16548/g.25028 Transcript_16548/m.25028 type:complete len:438 (+) Transcript_16548:105-1418(+)
MENGSSKEANKFRLSLSQSKSNVKTVIFTRISSKANEDSSSSRKEPTYRSVSRRNCPLMHYIWECNWPAALKRIETNPEELFYVTDTSGRTALHLASFNQGSPVYVAESLLAKNQHALLAKDRNRRTPLHYACTFNRGGSKHLVPLYCDYLMMLQGKCTYDLPPIDGTDSYVPSPLLLACCNCSTSVDTIRILISTARQSIYKWIAPKTGCEPYWFQSVRTKRDSPLQALLDWANVQEMFNLDRKSITNLLSGDFPVYSKNLISLASECSPLVRTATDTIQKIVLLMDAHGNDYTGSLLHRVCAIHAPKPWLIELFGSLMPEQTLIRDSEGCLPLHHLILHPFATNKKELVDAILQINKQATTRKILKFDSYPLLVAIQQGWTWEGGLEGLVQATPELLDVQADHGLYPTALAASMDTELNTLFELLRKAPHLCANH